jgi:acetolactate synthase-1/2/3 large subunit
MHGGDRIASVLAAQGVHFLFTLCGGHISPILVAAKRRGIRVVDTRHEATAVFAADAVARLSGHPSVAAVTAGPGVTNTVTAVKNAQMAQSPVVLIGGAAPTVLQGRGALQDIEQLDLMRSVVKWSRRVRRLRDLIPTLEAAFRISQEGVPGPVFVECPVDLLYDEATVRSWYGVERGGKTLFDRLIKSYLRFRANRLFAGAENSAVSDRIDVAALAPDPALLNAVVEKLKHAQRPLLLVGSQAMLQAQESAEIAEAVSSLGIPVYLSGMARGLLGRQHPLQLRHKRRQALRQADLVILAGVPCDFRLDYGNHINRKAWHVSINRSNVDLYKNRRPNCPILGDPGLFLRQLATRIAVFPSVPIPSVLLAENQTQPLNTALATLWPEWLATLRNEDEARNAEIRQQMSEANGDLNPLHLCAEIDAAIGADTILVADGGDFVATASYIVRPPAPLTWLDPGAFGTLGVGAGFAMGAKLLYPEKDVWILYGDGSVGYSLAEFDTFRRHGIAVTAVVGNDGGWTQIAREQVTMLGDDVGTVLGQVDYERVVESLGGVGVRVNDPELAEEALAESKQAIAQGKSVLVNAILVKSDFRKGSISM